MDAMAERIKKADAMHQPSCCKVVYVLFITQ
jgi:hypothetical protein